MKDRLLKFLNREELSSARFAEIIDVQPSSVSHILSGRNKPGFDFIQKILINFPSLNADWLIMGKGNMLKNHGIQRDLFSDNPGIHLREQPVPRQADSNEEPEIIENVDQKESDKKNSGPGLDDTFVNKSKPEEVHKSNASNASAITNVNYDKTVERIVIFYSDKSFEDYSPA